MTRQSYLVWMAVILLAAIALQFGLFEAGFYRISADESSRSLMAYDLSWRNALEPYVWPPFYKVVVGSFLKLYRDVFVAPHLLVSVVGLLAIPCLVRIADLLFHDRLINVITATMALVMPHRLIFSVVPLSDIFYFDLTLAAAMFILMWLQKRHLRDLLAGCFFLFLSETVRYEACFFGLVLILFLAYRWLVSRDVDLKTVVLAGLLLFSFPVLWAIDSYYWYGSLDNLRITSLQFIGIYGKAYVSALRWNPLVRSFRLDVTWDPFLLIGMAAVVWYGRRDFAIRSFALLFGAPLVVISAVMVITLSIPLAAPWRTSGAWALLLLPFTAAALVRIAGWLQHGGGRRWALPVLVALAVFPLAARSAVYVHDGMFNFETGHWRQDRKVGLYLAKQLAAAGRGKVLLDSYLNLDYFDVLTGSSAPTDFLLTADGDPVTVGAYVPMRDKYLREQNKPIIEKYLADHYDLAEGGSVEAFAAKRVRFVVVRYPGFIHALDASPRVERLRAFTDWVVYRVRPDHKTASTK